MIKDEVTLTERTGWRDAITAFKHPRVITMLFFGFSAGLPLLLIFSSLSLWLREAGIDRSVVTYFSWAALGYSFKFIWAPLVDSLKLPVLTRLLGRRRGWILLAQILIMAAIILMASIDPAQNKGNLTYLAFAAVMLGFSAATQDIVIDAYRIESAQPGLQALMSSTYIAGYRIGMIVAGAGALYLASYFGSTEQVYSYSAWQYAYWIMAAFMVVGVITTLVISEPEIEIETRNHQSSFNLSQNIQIVILFVGASAGFVLAYTYLSDTASALKFSFGAMIGNDILSRTLVEFGRLIAGLVVASGIAFIMAVTHIIPGNIFKKLYLEPVKDFFERYGIGFALLLLLLIGLYRISDIVLGVISNVFYYDLGYSKNEIATVTKLFGLLVTLTGGFLGGLMALRFGVMRVLLLGAILSAATNLLFMMLAKIGYSMPWLWLVIGADNLSAGIASAAFVAFLSVLTNIRFTAMQYAIFTSIMTLIPKVLGGYSGSMVDAIGYSRFFVLTAIIGIPVILLILVISKNSKISSKT